MFIFIIQFISPIQTIIPEGFVKLSSYDPTILQDIRYAGYHNFVGRPINGYTQQECILTIQAAEQLRKNQQVAISMGYRLKVWDCYRPQKAVDDFYNWSLNNDTTMQQEFYPDEVKELLFEHGYIAKKSGHSRGSTIDLTLVNYFADEQESYHPGDNLIPCYNENRFKDNTINMGTGFDCFDAKAHTYYGDISDEERNNRDTLIQIMMNYTNYIGEWWHFTLINEPFKNIYFDFDI